MYKLTAPLKINTIIFNIFECEILQKCKENIKASPHFLIILSWRPYVTIMQYKKKERKRKSSLTLESDFFPHSLQYPGMTFCKVTSLLYCTNSKLCLIIIYE